MNLPHETAVTYNHCPCHAHTRTHTVTRTAEQSQAEVPTYCQLTCSPAALAQWRWAEDGWMDEWIDWWMDGSRIKVMERAGWSRSQWWSVILESDLFCPVSLQQYLRTAAVDFNIFHKSLQTFKLQQNIKLIYQFAVPISHSDCTLQLMLRLFPKLLWTIPIPFLCSLNTNMTHHNSLYWKQSVAQTSEDCILYQHVHMLLSYYWKYNNLLTVSVAVWLIFMCTTQTLCCLYYYVWSCWNFTSTRVIKYQTVHSDSALFQRRHSKSPIGTSQPFIPILLWTACTCCLLYLHQCCAAGMHAAHGCVMQMCEPGLDQRER